MPIASSESNGSVAPITTSSAIHDSEVDQLRASVAKLEERERRLMELLHTTMPERIEHDLRNVLNELVLLRTLLDLKPADS